MVSGCRVHSKPELTRKVTDRSASNTKNMLQGPAMTWGSIGQSSHHQKPFCNCSQRSRDAHHEGSLLPKRSGSGLTDQVVLKLQQDLVNRMSQAFRRNPVSYSLEMLVPGILQKLSSHQIPDCPAFSINC